MHDKQRSLMCFLLYTLHSCAKSDCSREPLGDPIIRQFLICAQLFPLDQVMYVKWFWVPKNMVLLVQKPIHGHDQETSMLVIPCI